MPNLRKRKVTIAATTPPQHRPPRMEYHSRPDGSWYGARMTVQDGWLRIMFEEFTEDMDEWYDPEVADLASPLGVTALRARFRSASLALDDARCGDLRTGDRLCLTCEIYGGDLKYYDAVLDTVERAVHCTMDGEERCACRFTVRWTEGPRTGCWDKVGVNVICCVQESPIQDPVLSEFLDCVTKMFQAASSGEGEIAPVQSHIFLHWLVFFFLGR